MTPGADETPTTPGAGMVSIAPSAGMIPTMPFMPTTSSAGTKEEHVEYATPPPDAYDLVDANHDDDVPVRFRALADVGVSGTPPGLADREVEGGHLMFTTAKEPSTFREAEQHECCKKAMQEINSIVENGT
jgi:hypothetical protein